MISAVVLLYFFIRVEDKIARYIYTIVSWTAICFAMTQALSAFHGLNLTRILMSWGMIDTILLILNILNYKKTKCIQANSALSGLHFSKRMAIWTAFAFGMICLALKTVPYNWDSMTYHLPRIFHWLQNGSVEHYATHNDRQVASPVLGAFINLHVYAISNGKDVFLNLLQCCSYLTNGIFVYYIAKKIKCSEKYCAIAITLFYSMPIAFAEALTTQVDNFSTLWLLGFAYLLLDFLNPEQKILLNRANFFRVLALGLCISFGYLAKPSVGFGMIFLSLWLLIVVIRRKDRFIILLSYIIVAGGVLLTVLSPEVCRNISTFNAISASGVGQRQLIGTLQKRNVLVNSVKNFTFNMPSVWLYNSQNIIYKYNIRLARWLDVNIDDPTISEDGREFEVREPQDYGHDTAVNALIIWLMIICILFWLLKNRKRHMTEIKNQYFFVATISFIVFCMILRWEPFVSRYMLSYLALLCPALAGQIEIFFDTGNKRICNAEPMFTAIIYFLCVTELIGMLYYHGNIALESKKFSGYFKNRGEADIEDNYSELIEYVTQKGYKNIGLMLGGDTYEYPLLHMVDNNNRIEHVNVSNATEKYESADFIPDIIIVIDYALEQDAIFCHDIEYKITHMIDDNTYVMERAAE